MPMSQTPTLTPTNAPPTLTPASPIKRAPSGKRAAAPKNALKRPPKPTTTTKVKAPPKPALVNEVVQGLIMDAVASGTSAPDASASHASADRNRNTSAEAPMFAVLIPEPEEIRAGGKGKMLPEHRRFAVQMLACYRTPQQVAHMVRDLFGVEISRQSIEFYDPGKASGAGLSPELCRLFAATRRRFHDRASDIGIAHQVYRLSEMHDNYNLLKARGAIVQAQAVLEQAAREVGGMFTNARIVTGQDGAPLMGETMSREEHIEAIQMLILTGHQRAQAQALTEDDSTEDSNREDSNTQDGDSEGGP
jgi:hypothetical protein